MSPVRSIGMTDRPAPRPRTRVGRLGPSSEDVTFQYRALAEEDERVGRQLLEQGAYRQAAYLIVQAMEKYVRVRIFAVINPTFPLYQRRTRTHDLDDLLDFLLEIVVSEDIREQVRSQLKDHVLGGVRFNELHNDLRYPIWLSKRRSYASLQIDRAAAETVVKRLEALKQFLAGLDRLRR
jgi:HEPN domain-containing protein